MAPSNVRDSSCYYRCCTLLSIWLSHQGQDGCSSFSHHKQMKMSRKKDGQEQDIHSVLSNDTFKELRTLPMLSSHWSELHYMSEMQGRLGNVVSILISHIYSYNQG